MPPTHQERQERLINLNKIEVLLGVAVAIISLAGAVGCWYVLPYRMALAEAEIKDLRKQLTDVKTDAQHSQELLVRIDERLRQVQRALKIPTDAYP